MDSSKRNRLYHSKLKQVGQMSQSHVLLSTPDRKDMNCALILQKELASSWGRAFPRSQSAHPPRSTGEGRLSVPNLGLLPRVLEGNQVTNILLIEIWSPLTGRVGFFQA